MTNQNSPKSDDKNMPPSFTNHSRKQNICSDTLVILSNLESLPVLTLSQAIEAYLTSQSRLLSPASIKMYRQSTGFLLKTFDGDQLIEDLDKYQLIKWRDSLFTARRFQGHPYIKNQDGRLSVHTIRRIIADCKAFFAWLVTVGLLDSSPLAGVQKPKAPENAPKAISVEDFENIFPLSASERKALSAPGLFRVDVTPYFVSLIDPENPNDPIRKQIIPKATELDMFTAQMEDSLAEDAHSPVPGLSLIHI